MTKQEKIFLEDGFRVIYEIDSFTSHTIQDGLEASGLKGGIKSMETGTGGKELLRKFEDPFQYVTEYSELFEPRESNELVNPILESGLRLSSYMFYIELEDGTVKIIPKNPLNNFKI